MKTKQPEQAITIRFPVPVVEALRVAAQEEKRSFNGEVIWALEQFIAQRRRHEMGVKEAVVQEERNNSMLHIERDNETDHLRALLARLTAMVIFAHAAMPDTLENAFGDVSETIATAQKWLSVAPTAQK